MTRRLERSAADRVWTGVCGGLAEYLQVDPTLVRAFFVIASIFTAFAFVLVYIVLLILMPLPGQRAPVDDLVRGGAAPAAPPAGPASGTAEPAPDAATQGGAGAADDRPRDLLGWILIAAGLIFLVGNMGAFRLIQWGVVWPLILVALGVLLLVQRSRR